MNKNDVTKAIEEALTSWSPEDTSSISDDDLDTLNADLDGAIDSLRDAENEEEEETGA